MSLMSVMSLMSLTSLVSHVSDVSDVSNVSASRTEGGEGCASKPHRLQLPECFRLFAIGFVISWTEVKEKRNAKNTDSHSNDLKLHNQSSSLSR